MNVLLVFAHPEPRSLNGALRDVAVAELKAQDHEVRISDLYAEGWKSEIDRADFRNWRTMHGSASPPPRARRSKHAC